MTTCLTNSALEARLGRAVALSSVYRLLQRHDWRKLVPDKRDPQGDGAAQEEWKKNSPRGSSKSSRSSKRKGRSGVGVQLKGVPLVAPLDVHAAA